MVIFQKIIDRLWYGESIKIHGYVPLTFWGARYGPCTKCPMLSGTLMAGR